MRLVVPLVLVLVAAGCGESRNDRLRVTADTVSVERLRLRIERCAAVPQECAVPRVSPSFYDDLATPSWPRPLVVAKPVPDRVRPTAIERAAAFLRRLTRLAAG